jgi:hypothetical protein
MASILSALKNNFDYFLKQSGYEAAIEFVRQCWINRTMTPEEILLLQNLKKISSGCPTLSILIDAILKSSKKLESFVKEDTQTCKIQLNVNQYTAYEKWSACTRYYKSNKLLLKPKEELKIFGRIVQKRNVHLPIEFKFPLHSFQDDYVERIEVQLLNLLNPAQSDIGAMIQLKYYGSNRIEKEIYEDLNQSQDIHISNLKNYQLRDLSLVDSLKTQVQTEIVKVRKCIQDILDIYKKTIKYHGILSSHGHATLTELVHGCIHISYLVSLFPSLNSEQIQKLKDYIIY